MSNDIYVSPVIVDEAWEEAKKHWPDATREQAVELAKTWIRNDERHQQRIALFVRVWMRAQSQTPIDAQWLGDLEQLAGINIEQSMDAIRAEIDRQKVKQEPS